jgi:hypothetical protein
MKINRVSDDLNVAALEEWHSWFAWHPVRISNTQLIWLEIVERKGNYYRNFGMPGFWVWSYRARGQS